MPKPPAIGIDLGTTYSCVAVYQNGRVDIIPNKEGNKTTPSMVAFRNEEIVVGESASLESVMNVENTIYETKRLIGRRFNDPGVQRDIRNWPFKVDKKHNEPVYCVQTKKKFYKPEEISSLVLCHMKEAAQRRLQNPNITEAVITVPAYFNDSQRRATKNAAISAGLKVLRIINEPTAASLAYGHLRTHAVEKNILVFDLGGGTLDVSILNLDDDLMFEVRACTGDSHLGGQDFDNLLVELCKRRFKNRYGMEIKDKRALSRLKIKCEQTKRSLSKTSAFDINLINLYNEKDLNLNITRQKFEEECDDLFKICIDTVKKCIDFIGGGFTKADIDEVILVGGSSRIPKIQEMLRELFGGKPLNNSIHPDEAVAHGAAVHAALLSGCRDSDLDSLLLIDINPLALGVAVDDGVMSTVVKRHSRLPLKAQNSYATSVDNQQTATFKVYEGERPLVKDNNLLGNFDVSNIKRAPKGETKFTATFDIDADGILHVSAVEKGTKNKNNITITSDHRSDSVEVEEMLGTARKYRELDENIRQIIVAKSRLENFAYTISKKIKKEDKSSKDGKKDIVEECYKITNWLYAELTPALEEVEEKNRSLEMLCADRIEDFEELRLMLHPPHLPIRRTQSSLDGFD